MTTPRSGFGLLAKFLDFKAMARVAVAEGELLTTRHDLPDIRAMKLTPEQYRRVADLDDQEPFWFRTPQGYRITGRLLPKDFERGSASAAAPVLLALAPVLPFLLLLLPLILGTEIGTGLAIGTGVFYLWLVGRVAGARWMGIGLLLALLPMLFEGASTHLAQAFTSLGLSSFANAPRPILLVLAAAYLWWGTGTLRQRLIPLAVAALVLHQLLPAFAQPMAYLLLPCSLPYLWDWSLRMARVSELTVQGTQANVESTGKTVGAHAKARADQLTRALQDPTPFIEFGRDIGVFHSKMDGYCPSTDAVFGYTLGDSGTHTIGFGGTGSGKTMTIGRTYVHGVLTSTVRNGLLLLDAKGSEGAAYAHLENFILVEPGRSNLAPLEGMPPETWASAISSVQVSAKALAGANSEWIRWGQTMLRHVSVLVDALTEVQDNENALRAKEAAEQGVAPQLLERKFKRTVRCLRNTLEEIQDEAVARAYADWVRASHPHAHARATLLPGTLQYVGQDLWNLDPKMRSNILSSPSGWLETLMSCTALLPWCDLEHGVDVAACCRGASVAVNLPELKYGIAGKTVQNLVKERFIHRVRTRPDDWRTSMPGETDVSLVVDECQELVSESDFDLLSVGRSKGVRMFYLTQSINSLWVKMGQDLGTAFAGNFQSRLSFQTTPQTRDFMLGMLGTTETLVYTTPAKGIDWKFTALLAAESPLNDPTHPDYRMMRAMVRAGGGDIRAVGEKRMDGGLFRRGRNFRHTDIADDTAVDVVTNAQFITQPLLTEAEWDAFVHTPFTAVASLMRGGVRRRGIIRTNPHFTIGVKGPLFKPEPPAAATEPVATEPAVTSQSEAEAA